MSRSLADLALALHFAFVLFVVFGGLAVLRRPRWAWAHVPAVLWGAWIEMAGWICPLTPLENWLRERGDGDPYERGFVEHYLLRALYPEGLGRREQIALGVLVLALNAALYGWIWIRGRRRGRACT